MQSSQDLCNRLKMLNIGCGEVFHKDWINLDLVPQSPIVMQHDLRKGLPFADTFFDACYSSHLFEHMRKNQAASLVKELYRVLRKGGILRVAVPDLECICINYLKYLQEVASGELNRQFRYEFTVFELFDQFTRERTGGQWKELLGSAGVGDKNFIIERWGWQAIPREGSQTIQKAPTRVHLRHRIKQNIHNRFLGARVRLVEAITRFLLGEGSLTAFREGMFRNSGEIHRVMYDRYSLPKLLRDSSFVDIEICEANKSRIPNFMLYELEAIDGQLRKPDSLIVEAIRN